ncbi:MAG: hypothetical protein WKG07_19175 [Hymenobacter sp.]
MRGFPRGLPLSYPPFFCPDWPDWLPSTTTGAVAAADARTFCCFSSPIFPSIFPFICLIQYILSGAPGADNSHPNRQVALAAAPAGAAECHRGPRPEPGRCLHGFTQTIGAYTPITGGTVVATYRRFHHQPDQPG